MLIDSLALPRVHSVCYVQALPEPSQAHCSAPVPAVPRPAAAVMFPFVGPLKGAGSLTPVSVVPPLMPVFLGSIRMIPGFALRPRARLFPFVAVSVCTLQLLPAVLGLQVRRAMVVVPARAAAVAAGSASRPRAVRARQTAPVIVAFRSDTRLKRVIHTHTQAYFPVQKLPAYWEKSLCRGAN